MEEVEPGFKCWLLEPFLSTSSGASSVLEKGSEHLPLRAVVRASEKMHVRGSAHSLPGMLLLEVPANISCCVVKGDIGSDLDGGQS